MKKQNKLLIKGLKLSLAFLIMLMLEVSYEANGQIIYTDIQPDTTIYTPDIDTSNNYYNIDLNSDSIDDYRFICYNNSYSGNEQLGISFIALDNNKCNIMEHYLYGDTINVSQGDNYWDNPSHLIYGWSGSSIGHWAQEENYGYIGLQLINDNDTLLGWVNIEIPVDKTFGVIIKAYAYNTNPGESILAGQTQLSKNNHSYDDDIFVYTHDGNVFIEFNNNIDSPQGTIEIINNQGQKVSESILNGYNSVVDVSRLQPGIYFVKINLNQNIVITRKIYIK